MADFVGPTNGEDDGSDDANRTSESPSRPPTNTSRRRTWTMTLDDDEAEDRNRERKDSDASRTVTDDLSSATSGTTTTAAAASQYWRKWEECQDRHEHDEKKQRMEAEEEEEEQQQEISSSSSLLLFGERYYDGQDNNNNQRDDDADADEERDGDFARQTSLKVEQQSELATSNHRQRSGDNELDQFLLPSYEPSLTEENNQKLNINSSSSSSTRFNNRLLAMSSSLEKLPVTGLRQSPIDIKSSRQSNRNQMPQSNDPSDSSEGATIPLEIDYSLITGASGLTIENTGNGWKLNIPDELAAKCPITGGPLGSDEYRLLQIHSHWGRDASCGSEHTLDGKAFPSEIHLVHWNATRYSYPVDAMECSNDGLAVVGVFVKFSASEGEPPNPTLDLVIKSLSQIPFCGDIVPLDDSSDLDLNSLIAHRTEGPKYWSYAGSLTTPPFCESVIWIVMEQPVEAQEEQIAQFRQMNQNACTADEIRPLEENFREAQPLHNRNVDYYN